MISLFNVSEYAAVEWHHGNTEPALGEIKDLWDRKHSAMFITVSGPTVTVWGGIHPCVPQT